MLFLYRLLTKYLGFIFEVVLRLRLKKSKEDAARINERRGLAGKPRPDNSPLIWIHAASVGEAQSALILIQEIRNNEPTATFLVTSGTKSSAEIMGNRLPDYAIHQFIPLDNPRWVERFLDHWRPDMGLWMESELWPNLLLKAKKKKIPLYLINGHMSPVSFRRWKNFPGSIKKILSPFKLLMMQTQADSARYEALGAKKLVVTDNIKYAAPALPFDTAKQSTLEKQIGDRPFWLYASTHDGEEDIAMNIHSTLKSEIPDLLTIIVPRHPERRDDIVPLLYKKGLSGQLRSKDKDIKPDSDIYIVDTLGELGLFYSLSPFAVIGRSLSNDGGGGHNPLEAAQLKCAVLHGPNVQNLQKIFDDMLKNDACIMVQSVDDLKTNLRHLLKNPDMAKAYQDKAMEFAQEKQQVLPTIMQHLLPAIKKSYK